MAATAGVVNHVDHQHRDGRFLTSHTTHITAGGHAVTVDRMKLDGLAGDWLLGTARVRVSSPDPGDSVFVGIARSDDVDSYLQGVSYSSLTEIDDPATTYGQHDGGRPAVTPDQSDIWTAQSSGQGTQTLQWKPQNGTWTLVVMNQDASSGINVTADVGATAPIVPRLVHWMFAAAIVSGLAGALALLLLARPMGIRRTLRS